MRRVPLLIEDTNSGDVLKFHGNNPDYPSKLFYESIHTGVRNCLHPWEVEKDYSTDRVVPQTEVVRQGKFECAAASLSLLLGHSLFHVKSAMGLHGWCNDNRGACDKVMRLAAREFGRDLIYGGKRTVSNLGAWSKVPDCTITVPSLNVPGMCHSVTWINDEIVDPNFGHETRKFWSAKWAPWTMGAYNVLILAKRPLTEQEHKDLEWVRNSGSFWDVEKAIVRMAA